MTADFSRPSLAVIEQGSAVSTIDLLATPSLDRDDIDAPDSLVTAKLVNSVVEVLAGPYEIAATIEVPRGGAEGVIVSRGGSLGGYCLFLQDGRAYFVHNYVGLLELRVTSTETVPEGIVPIRFSFVPTDRHDQQTGKSAPGVGRLFFGDRLVGTQLFPVTIPIAFPASSRFTVGRNPGSPVSSMYETPFPFTGRILSAMHDFGRPKLTLTRR